MRNATLAVLAGLICACGNPGPPPAGRREERDPAAPLEQVAMMRADAQLAEAGGVAEPAALAMPPAAPPGGAPREAAAADDARELRVRVSTMAATLLAPALGPAFEAAAPGWHLVRLRSSDRSGIEEVMAGRADAALVAAELSHSERDHGMTAQALGDYVVVLIVPVSSAARSLTLEQVRDTLSGQHHDWSEVAYQRGPIELLLETTGPRSKRQASLLLAGDAFPKDAERLPAGALPAEVGDRPRALGVSSLGLIRGRRNVRALAVQGVSPTAQNLRSGRYRYGCTLQLVHRFHPGPGVLALLAFLRGEPGRRVLDGSVTPR